MSIVAFEVLVIFTRLPLLVTSRSFSDSPHAPMATPAATATHTASTDRQSPIRNLQTAGLPPPRGLGRSAGESLPHGRGGAACRWDAGSPRKAARRRLREQRGEEAAGVAAPHRRHLLRGALGDDPAAAVAALGARGRSPSRRS